MTCAGARDALLEADAGRLQSTEAATPLGAHLAACAACRSLASAITVDTTRLGAMLALRRRARRRTARRRGIALLAALPIAATLIFVVSRHATNRDIAAAPTQAAPRSAAAAQVSLTVAPGQRATVLKTADPNVTVIWLSPGEGQ